MSGPSASSSSSSALTGELRRLQSLCAGSLLDRLPDGGDRVRRRIATLQQQIAAAATQPHEETRERRSDPNTTAQQKVASVEPALSASHPSAPSNTGGAPPSFTSNNRPHRVIQMSLTESAALAASVAARPHTANSHSALSLSSTSGACSSKDPCRVPLGSTDARLGDTTLSSLSIALHTHSSLCHRPSVLCCVLGRTRSCCFLHLRHQCTSSCSRVAIGRRYHTQHTQARA